MDFLNLNLEREEGWEEREGRRERRGAWKERVRSGAAEGREREKGSRRGGEIGRRGEILLEEPTETTR